MNIGHYEVIDLIGDGGMGAVYRARDPRFDRLVAIKVLHPQFQRDPGVVERFKSEAVIQAKLNHPHIVTVHDFIADETTLAIVMEHIEGAPLDQIIEKSHGPMAVERVVRIMDQVLSAMDYAHKRGLVHRDIKPSNILIQSLEQQEYARVMDFGIAKILGSEKVRTATGAKMGTLAYMSPEHVKSPKHVDARSDIYSLGVVLYEMLTGRVPFDADSEYELMRRIVEAPIDVAVDRATGAPMALREIIERAMAKDPDVRFQSCEEMRSSITQRALLSGARVKAGASPDTSDTTARAPQGSFDRDVSTPRPTDRSMLVIGIVGIVILTVALVIAGVIAIVAVGGRASKERARADSSRVMNEQERLRTGSAHVVPEQEPLRTEETPAPRKTLPPSDPLEKAINEIAKEPALSASRTDLTLRRDVMRTIITGLASKGCRVSAHDSRIVSPPVSNGVWVEGWDLSICGKMRNLRINFTPSPDGGTDYTVSE